MDAWDSLHNHSLEALQASHEAVSESVVGSVVGGPITGGVGWKGWWQDLTQEGLELSPWRNMAASRSAAGSWLVCNQWIVLSSQSDIPQFCAPLGCQPPIWITKLSQRYLFVYGWLPSKCFCEMMNAGYVLFCHYADLHFSLSPSTLLDPWKPPIYSLFL